MTPTPVSQLLLPAFVIAFCLQHAAGLYIGSNISASICEAKADPIAMGTAELSRSLVSEDPAICTLDCSHNAGIPQSIIKTDYHTTEFYINPCDEFRGLQILLHGWSSNSTLQYPRDVIHISDSMRWYLVTIDISTGFGRVFVELKTNFSSLRCVTNIRDVVGPNDVQCMEVLAVGPAKYMTPHPSQKTTPSNNLTVIPAEQNCNHTFDPNLTPHSNTNDTAPCVLPPSGSTTTLIEPYLILIVVLVALVVVVVVVVVVMVVHRKRSFRGEHKKAQ